MYNLENVFKSISNEHNQNIELFNQEYQNLSYEDYFGNTLYHLVIKSNKTDNHILLAIKTLALEGINPNKRNNEGDSFLHTAIKERISPILFEKILEIFEDTNTRVPLNIGIQNKEGQNLSHLVISCIPLKESLEYYLKVLKKYDFPFLQYDNHSKNAIDLINLRWGLTEEDKNMLKDIMLPPTPKYNPSQKPKDKRVDTSEISKFGMLLNYKDYPKEPAIGREQEIKQLVVSLATEKKMPILIGNSGIGKTAIVDEFVYLIKNGTIPNFLKDKLVFELNLSNALAGTRYRGDFEKNITDVLDFVRKNNAILFIDEIHMIFGAGASRDDKTDAASIIKTYIDRYELQVIGATTSDEYYEYMANDPLKRRFEVIQVKELDNLKLYDIALKAFDELQNTKELHLDNEMNDHLDEIIEILLALTNVKNRRYDDKSANPDILISIINRAFAYALVDDEEYLNIKHLIMSINDNQRIYPSAKDSAINNLNNIAQIKQKARIIRFEDYQKKH